MFGDGRMRIGDNLFFAPGIKFSDVDTTGETFAQQLDCRIRGFYLQPVRSLIQSGHAFAAGVILVVAIDALARLETGSEEVGKRFQDWCVTHLTNCSKPISKRFYDAFRNGLVHEARIKNGGEFSLEANEMFQEMGDVLVCNPARLLAEVESVVAVCVRTLDSDPGKLQAVRGRILEDFACEFRN